MRFEHLEVGMKLKANLGSDEVYTVTTNNRSCVVIVEEIEFPLGVFTGKVIQHEEVDFIGCKFEGLEAEYFDCIQESNTGAGIKVQLKTPVNCRELAVGDIVKLKNGKTMAIITDYDGHDYRGFIFEDLHVTDLFDFISELEEYIDCEFGGIERFLDRNALILKEI